MAESDKLVQLVVQIFWAVATACTTDINSKAREWLILRFNQAYFQLAQKQCQVLVMLGQAGTIGIQLNESVVISSWFGRWLDCQFDQSEQQTTPLRQLLDIVRHYDGQCNTQGMRDLLRKQRLTVQKADRLGMQNPLGGYVCMCKTYVEALVTAALEKRSDMTGYQNDYESVLFQIAGKAVVQVKKPTWAELETDVRMTVIKLAHQAANRDRMRFDDCFDSAINQFAQKQEPTDSITSTQQPNSAHGAASPASDRHGGATIGGGASPASDRHGGGQGEDDQHDQHDQHICKRLARSQ